jgi:hypothetical protein
VVSKPCAASSGRTDVAYPFVVRKPETAESPPPFVVRRPRGRHRRSHCAVRGEEPLRRAERDRSGVSNHSNHPRPPHRTRRPFETAATRPPQGERVGGIRSW